MGGGREGAGLGDGSESGQGEAWSPWLEGQMPRAVLGGGWGGTAGVAAVGTR